MMRKWRARRKTLGDMISILKKDITNEQVGTVSVRVFGLGG